jgi:predicted nucleic acid-binding protein
MPGRAFDTNVFIYAYSTDPKAEIAKALMHGGGTISVQNLNEFANVAYRKLGFSWEEISQAVDDLVTMFGTPLALTLDIHQSGRKLAKRYNLAFYDSLMVAAALYAECDLLYSEDMHHGLIIEERLRIENPFRV